MSIKFGYFQEFSTNYRVYVKKYVRECVTFSFYLQILIINSFVRKHVITFLLKYLL